MPSAIHTTTTSIAGLHIILGQHHQSVKAIAPQCQGLSIPILVDGKEDAIPPYRQADNIAPVNPLVGC